MDEELDLVERAVLDLECRSHWSAACGRRDEPNTISLRCKQIRNLRRCVDARVECWSPKASPAQVGQFGFTRLWVSTCDAEGRLVRASAMTVANEGLKATGTGWLRLRRSC